MAKLLRAAAAGFLALRACSADDTVSMVQHRVATEPAQGTVFDENFGRNSKAEAWEHAQADAAASFRAEREKQFEAYRVRARLAAERKAKKAADAAEAARLLKEQQAEEAAKKTAALTDMASLRDRLKEQHATAVKEKREEQATSRTSVEHSRAAQKEKAQKERAQLKKQVKLKIKQDVTALEAAKPVWWKEPDTVEKKTDSTYTTAAKNNLMRLTFVDRSGKKKSLQLPKIAQMSVVMKTAGKRFNVDWQRMRFLHDGQSLSTTDTLQASGLQDDDIINIVPLE